MFSKTPNIDYVLSSDGSVLLSIDSVLAFIGAVLTLVKGKQRL
jgi:hypothetical protein